MAAFWNMPIVTWVAMSSQFANKKAYPTLGRTMGSFAKMGGFLATVFRRCGWQRVGFLSSSHKVIIIGYSGGGGGGVAVNTSPNATLYGYVLCVIKAVYLQRFQGNCFVILVNNNL